MASHNLMIDLRSSHPAAARELLEDMRSVAAARDEPPPCGSYGPEPPSL